MTRQRMVQDLVSRAHTIGDRVGIEVPPLAAEGNNDEAGYAFFFERFLTDQPKYFAPNGGKVVNLSGLAENKAVNCMMKWMK